VDVVVRADRDGDRARLTPVGQFNLPHAVTAARAIANVEAALAGCRLVELDLRNVGDIDGTGAVQLASLLDRWIGDVLALVGGLIATIALTDMSARAYVIATADAISGSIFLGGLAKTPFLALAIGSPADWKSSPSRSSTGLANLPASRDDTRSILGDRAARRSGPAPEERRAN
jgi:hypothetical protein